MGWSHGRRVVSHEPSSHQLWAAAAGFDHSLFSLLSSAGAVWVVLLLAGCPGLSRSSGAASRGGSCAATEADASVGSASAKWRSPASTTARSASATTGCARSMMGRSAQVRKPLWWQKLRTSRVYIISRNTLGTQHTEIVETWLCMCPWTVTLNRIVGTSRDFTGLKNTSQRHCLCRKMGRSPAWASYAAGAKAGAALGWRLCRLFWS